MKNDLVDCICFGEPEIYAIDVSYHGSPIYEYMIKCNRCGYKTKQYNEVEDAKKKWNTTMIKAAKELKL